MITTAEQVVRIIEANGGRLLRQRGSHRRYTVGYIDAEGRHAVAHTTVAMHSGDLPVGTLRAIERQLAPALGKGWLR